MGIWATWVPLGSSIMLVAAPLLAGASSWPRVWWFGAAWAAAGAVLYLAFVRPAPHRAGIAETGASPPATTSADLRRVLRNRDLWLIALEFGCFNFGVIGFATWTPTFLNATRGLSLAQASFLVSLAMMVNIVSGPLSGVVSDAIGSRRWIIVIPLALMAPVWPLAHALDGGAFVSLMVAYGLVGGCVPTGTFAAATEAVGDERLGGMAMAVVQVGQNAGMLRGPLVVGAIVGASGSWSAAYWAIVPVTAVGVVAALAARMR